MEIIEELRDNLKKVEADIRRLFDESKGLHYDENTVDAILHFALQRQLEKKLDIRKHLLNQMFFLRSSEEEIELFKEINDKVRKIEIKILEEHRRLLTFEASKPIAERIDVKVMEVETALNVSWKNEGASFKQLPGEEYYGSNWIEMTSIINDIAINNQKEALTYYDGSDTTATKNKSWAEGDLIHPIFENVNICYTINSLYSKLRYSIPDILHINGFYNSHKIVSENWDTL